MFCRILKKGTGTPIVFLHGFLGTGQDWRGVAKYLSGRTCLAYDLPGHGKTPWTDEKIEDVLANAIGPKPIDLVGYSLGGRLAIRFALSHPARIRSLSLLSAHYGLPNNEEREARLQSDRMWAQKILSLSWEEFLFQWYQQPVFSSTRQKPAMMKKMLSSRKSQKPNELVQALLSWSLGYQDCYRDQLLVFSRLTRIIYGEKDEKFAKLYAGWPNAHSISESGHPLHFEATKEVAHLLATAIFQRCDKKLLKNPQF